VVTNAWIVESTAGACNACGVGIGIRVRVGVGIGVGVRVGIGIRVGVGVNVGSSIAASFTFKMQASCIKTVKMPSFMPWTPHLPSARTRSLCRAAASSFTSAFLSAAFAFLLSLASNSASPPA
jgi:hypothetical protein